MKVSIFDYLNYKDYLLARIEASPSRGRGLKRKMAEFLGVQTSYISQVLGASVHFNLEQAMKVNKFWEHSQEESRFLCLLINYARAGTQELEIFLRDEINEVLRKRENLKDRLAISDSLTEANQHIYYSSWTYAAIHILTSIPEFQTIDAIVKRLRLSRERVQANLKFLVETGLVIDAGARFVIGKTRIHLDAQSLQIQRHHYNWRSQAVNSIDRGFKEDLHYSTVASLAREDRPKIKEILIKAIEECRSIIKVSPEEDVHVITIDSFAL